MIQGFHQLVHVEPPPIRFHLYLIELNQDSKQI